MRRITVLFLIFAFIALKGYSQCGTANLLQTYPQATAYGSVNDAGYEPDRAFDMGSDSLITYWKAAYSSGGHQWGVNFGVRLDFCTVRLVWGSNDYPTGIVIRGTNDFSGFTTLAEISNNSSNIVTLNFTAPDTFRIVDIYVYGATPSSGFYKLSNVQIFQRSTNQHPSVTLNANSSYLLGTDINLTATASDPDGTITKVAFYQGTTKLGEDATSPYSYNWTGAALGTYSVTARAFDNSGDSTTSSAVSVTVSNAPSYLKNWNLTGSNINNSNSGIVSIGSFPTAWTAIDTSGIKLTVKGAIFAKKLTVTQVLWPDYVFDRDYKLRSLKDVESFINTNNHLPDVPSEREVKANGVNVGENQAVLLRKIEELTLYLIKQHKEQEIQLAAIKKMQQEINTLKRKVSKK